MNTKTADLLSMGQVLALINVQLPAELHVTHWTLKRIFQSVGVPRVANRFILQRDQLPELLAELKRRKTIPADLEIED